MNDKFFDLKQEKQNRIINAALKVFARNRYRHASTDEIVKEAGISKGLIFHYFESKAGLYEFLFEYSARFMLLELSREVDGAQTDFFELVRQMERARMQVMKLYPYEPCHSTQPVPEPSPATLYLPILYVFSDLHREMRKINAGNDLVLGYLTTKMPYSVAHCSI